MVHLPMINPSVIQVHIITIIRVYDVNNNTTVTFFSYISRQLNKLMIRIYLYPNKVISNGINIPIPSSNFLNYTVIFLPLTVRLFTSKDKLYFLSLSCENMFITFSYLLNYIVTVLICNLY